MPKHNMSVEIKTVETRAELKKFVKFPLELYKNCPQYVPALHGQEEQNLTKAAPLAYCQSELCPWEGQDSGYRAAPTPSSRQSLSHHL